MKGYIGIDLGTGSSKGILTDARGNILATATASYGVSYPHIGWSEQNPADWATAFFDICGKLTDGFDGEIDGISFGGQMHGLIALDKDGNVLRPCILWNDGRTEKETAYLNEKIGRKTLTERTGNIAYAGFTAPKLLWMYENERDLFDRIAHVLLPKDYLVYLLTGRFSSDMSDASGTLLFDVAHKCWSKEMCEVCHLSSAVLPTLHESFDVVGTVTEEAARRSGLSISTKVIAGAGDNAAAAIGTGTVHHGDCNISLGTSGTVFISSDAYDKCESNALHAFAHANGAWHLMGCVLSAASCQSWFLESICKSQDYEHAVNPDDIGKCNVYFLPYLTGERSPHNDVNATGLFVGLRPDTTREQMMLAVLEGVTFALLDCIEIARKSGLKIERTTLCGGGAKSEVWRRLIASICSLDVYTAKAEQGPAMGGVILATVGCGIYPDAKYASEQMTETALSATPDPILSAYYRAKYEKWKKIYPAMKAIYPLLR